MSITQWMGLGIILLFFAALTALAASAFDSWRVATVLMGGALLITALLVFAAWLLVGGLT